MFKKTFFQIHWFLGITAGLILSLMGVTGAIYSYEQQILKWLNQESYVVQAENRNKLTPAEIYQHFQKTMPETKINSISIAASANESSTVNIVKEGERRGYNLMINPYTAAQLPEIKGREFFAFIQKLHRNLTVGPVGKQITGACTLMLIFFVLSGIYLRWPKRHSLKQWFFVKPQLKGRNFIWDLHAVVGTWVIVFYLIFAMTGLYWSYDWWRNGMFKVLGVERPQATMQAQSNPPQGQGRGEPMQRAENHTAPTAVATHEAHRSSARNKDEHLDQHAVMTALNQTWVGFNRNFNQKYSSATFNIPKKIDGELSISFIDVNVQHERARNNATYNYQNAEFSKVEMYEDKKLNEKIMSSMLPVHRGSFFGPIYQFVAMLASLSMPLFFVTGWMLYLKRRKQKKLTQAARTATSVLNLDPSAKPWLIVYASQTGTSEQLAWMTATSLQEAGQPTTVKAIQQLSLDELQASEQTLLIASTYGTGEAPDLASSFAKKYLSQTLDLSKTRFAVLALGSQEYAETYCSFGHRLYDWMQNNGATALFATIEVNNANPSEIQAWNHQLAKATQLKLNDIQIDKTFDSWILSQRDLLNPNSLGQAAFNIELKANYEALWQAGDIAEIQPGNSNARINQFLDKYQINPKTQVDSLCIEITAALRYKDLTQAVEPFANMEHLLEQLHDLPSREYSIASIPSQGVLRLVVRQQHDAQHELGLGSGWLTQHAAIASEIALRIRTNPSFHLIDDNRPIICIGNGTGIAGLMSLLETRIAQNYTQNWLIFGERQREHDFFYQEKLETWKITGQLQHLDLAFSRDQVEKVYVHHILQLQATELKSWLAQGAVLYVCGSIQGMANDVDQALIHILGEDHVNQLRQEGRYRRDVY